MATKNGNTTTNLSPNVASALCYIPFIGWVAAIVLFIVERNQTVKWNAAQAVLLTLALWALSFVFGATIVLAILVPLLMVAGLVLNLVLAVKAYQGSMVRLPVLADLTDKVVKKV
jgi:uncharacterized membrane protein